MSFLSLYLTSDVKCYIFEGFPLFYGKSFPQVFLEGPILLFFFRAFCVLYYFFEVDFFRCEWSAFEDKVDFGEGGIIACPLAINGVS